MEFDTGFWYFVSFAIFVGAAAGPVKKLLMEALKNKSTEISKDLSEAEKMKAQAEVLLAEAKQRHLDAQVEAQQIRAHAEKEAARAREQSIADVADFVTHQKAHLQDRIKQLEVTAVKEIHDHMIEVAVETAHTVVEKALTPEKDEILTAHELKKIKHLG